MIKIFSANLPIDLETQYIDWRKNMQFNIDIKNTSLSSNNNCWVMIVVYDFK